MAFQPGVPDPSQTDAPTAANGPAATQQPSWPKGSRRLGARGVFAAALLSALLASTSTAAILGVVDRSTEPAAAAPTANAVVTSNDGTVELADIVEAARQSVVTITADGMSTRGLSPFSVPTTGVGSGVILTSDGYILTNRHVVEGSDRLTVALFDGTELDATIVEESSENDLALVRVNATGLAAATIGSSSDVRVGDTAIAIGSPLGTYTETVTKGIISATGRSITVADELTGRPVELTDLLQTDAAINPGNSGGPVLDASGAVVGIATAVADSAEGLGFAIPIDAAADLIGLARQSSAG
jgi:serine protease Do